MTFLEFSNNKNFMEVDDLLLSLVKRACEATLEYENFRGDAEVSVTFTDNSEIHELNLHFRNIDRETDVLSFPLGENGEYDIDPENGAFQLGDIVISVEKAKQQAEEYGHSFNREVAFLTVHSMLHLLGYDHVNNKTEEENMFKRQHEILEKMGVKRE